MRCPDFKVGDRVFCEVRGDGRPRWDYGVDYGATGEYLLTTVIRVEATKVITDCPAALRKEWHWPLPGNPKYYIKQWEREGYLRKCDKPVGIIYNPLDRFINLEL